MDEFEAHPRPLLFESNVRKPRSSSVVFKDGPLDGRGCSSVPSLPKAFWCMSFMLARRVLLLCGMQGLPSKEFPPDISEKIFKNH